MPEYLVHITLSNGKRGTIAVDAQDELDAIEQARGLGHVPVAATLRTKPTAAATSDNPELTRIRTLLEKQEQRTHFSPLRVVVLLAVIALIVFLLI